MTTFKITDGTNLRGAQRNYKVAGKKLTPRDGHTASTGMTVREYARSAALEAKACGGDDSLYSRDERKYMKFREKLSTRRAKRVLFIFESSIMADGNIDDVMYQAAFLLLGNAEWRYYSALVDSDDINKAQEIDERMLRNAM